MKIVNHKQKMILNILSFTRKTPLWVFFLLARSTGLEPATSRVTGGCSNQLSYDRIIILLKQALTPVLCRREESNLRPWAYESHALTT